MAKISDPFAARPALPADPFSQLPPRFYPGTTSPLDDVARDAASLGVSIQSAQEQRRAELLPQQILAGDAAPRTETGRRRRRTHRQCRLRPIRRPAQNQNEMML